ncbi:MAG: hypothetical protein UDB11_01760 [Peptococcaceae bacterium]|nr:hypothetical protein [Peptococcaceae bacterium]
MTHKSYIFYLLFMMIACIGAFLWQFFLPQLALPYSLWGCAPGWQREIALWNIGLIATISYTLIHRSPALLRLMTYQATILCWLLGFHHLVTVLHTPSLSATIHWLGFIEVLIIGGLWGSIVLWRTKSNTSQKIKEKNH